MNRPRTFIPNRPTHNTGAAARNKKEAAIHLVRLEFDLGRIDAGMERAQQRLDAFSEELRVKQQHRDKLMAILNE